MRFGGHETFYIREGWLHKGLKLLREEPRLLVDEYSADWLGVGRNMAKSIRHWLLATGLSEIESKEGRKYVYRVTELGDLIWRNDPYFLDTGTWWALHVNLINNPDQATTWSWFFNRFTSPRFERAACTEALRRFLELSRKRLPSQRTLQRDIACLLGSYAKVIPPEVSDPEEAKICPFTELDILRQIRPSGVYQLNSGRKQVSSHLLGYCVSKARNIAGSGGNSQFLEISFHDAARLPNSPGKVFVLTAESLYEQTLQFETQESTRIKIGGLAGERVLKLKTQPQLSWLKDHYEAVGEQDANAA